MATIQDVARAAGVSPATVSRVFNGGRVSADRAERVRRAADELGFSPNRLARSLRLQRSSVIGLVIPDVANPFFTSLARGVEDAALRTGLSVVLCNSDEDVDKERRYLEVARADRMAGVIVASSSRRRTDLRPLLDAGIPVVAVDRRPLAATVDVVLLDDRHGGEEATAHLLDRGYRRLACITGPSGTWTSDERLAGFQAVMREQLSSAGCPDPEAVLDRYTRRADFRVDGGRAAMEELLALPEPPDAVLSANNLMAVGALAALHAAGLAPPRVGLAAFGDVPWAELLQTAPTVVELPSYELGFTAADLLQQRIGGPDAAPRTIVLRTALTVRGATAGPGAPTR